MKAASLEISDGDRSVEGIRGCVTFCTSSEKGDRVNDADDDSDVLINDSDLPLSASRSCQHP